MVAVLLLLVVAAQHQGLHGASIAATDIPLCPKTWCQFHGEMFIN
jgi:hypothetical protein